MQVDFITIRCAITTSRETRKHLWELMQTHTLLVNDLLKQVPQQPKFNKWRQQGRIPGRKEMTSLLNPLLDTLKQEPDYAHLPGRFYTSVKSLTAEIYASWLATHRKRLAELLGKQRWIRVVETELEFSKTHPFTLEKIHKEAQKVIATAKKTQTKFKGEISPARSERVFLGILLKMHETTKSVLKKRSINHLLLNNLKISSEPLELSKLEERIEAKKIRVKRLETQIQSQLPKGRDPTGQRQLQAVQEAIAFPSQPDLDEGESDSIQDNLTQHKQIPLLNELPYPINYSGSSEFYWEYDYDKICVKLKGLSSYSLKVNCGHRQLPLFKQIFVDYQTNASRAEEEKFSGALFTLRKAQLMWVIDPRLKYRNKLRRKKGQPEYTQPWDTHRLYLHCSVDRRSLTAEGTAQIQQEEQIAVQAILDNAEQKDPSDISPTQAQNIKRKRTQLKRLQNNTTPPRPSQPTYQGNPQRVMGICFSRHDPVVVAIVNNVPAQVLETHNTRSILSRGPQKRLWRNGKLKIAGQNENEQCHPNKGKLNTRQPGSQTKTKPHLLVNRLHQQYQKDRRLRAKAQKHDQYFRHSSVSDLGLYTNRLIAKKLVQLARDRQVSTIVIPKLEGIREIIESDVQAEAIRRYPNDKTRQKQHRKQYRASFHAWSYQELASCIQACAQKQGIHAIIQQQQAADSLVEKATQLALLEQVKTAA